MSSSPIGLEVSVLENGDIQLLIPGNASLETSDSKTDEDDSLTVGPIRATTPARTVTGKSLNFNEDYPARETFEASVRSFEDNTGEVKSDAESSLRTPRVSQPLKTSSSVTSSPFVEDNFFRRPVSALNTSAGADFLPMKNDSAVLSSTPLKSGLSPLKQPFQTSFKEDENTKHFSPYRSTTTAHLLRPYIPRTFNTPPSLLLTNSPSKTTHASSTSSSLQPQIKEELLDYKDVPKEVSFQFDRKSFIDELRRQEEEEGSEDDNFAPQSRKTEKTSSRKVFDSELPSRIPTKFAETSLLPTT